MSKFDSQVQALSRSIGAKNEKQWRFLVALWTCTGVTAWLAPWNLGVAGVLFAMFVHLAATESG